MLNINQKLILPEAAITKYNCLFIAPKNQSELPGKKPNLSKLKQKNK
jgi:hypothetical protein